MIRLLILADDAMRRAGGWLNYGLRIKRVWCERLISFSLFYPHYKSYFAFESRAEQQMEVYLRYGQHPELYPNRRGEILQG